MSPVLLLHLFSFLTGSAQGWRPRLKTPLLRCSTDGSTPTTATITPTTTLPNPLACTHCGQVLPSRSQLFAPGLRLRLEG